MGWTERQLPQADEIFLDHVGYFVENIETIEAPLKRLGFTPTPVNIHYNSDANGTLTRSGTANRLCTFKYGYIEMLGAVADTPLADQLQAGLARYSGLHLLAFTHENTERRRERLTADGFDLQETVRLRRPIQTRAGEKQVRAKVVRAKPGVFSESRVQMLTHETPDLIWVPDYSDHPNRVEALTDVFLISDAPEQKAEQYARFINGEVSVSDRLQVVSLPRGRLTFASPDTAVKILPQLQIPSLPYIAGVALRSADFARTGQFIETAGFESTVSTDSVICIGPDAGLGGYMVFHAPGIESVWTRIV